MRLKRTYYEIMGVDRSASPIEIKQKYHDLARLYHPDRAADKDLAQRLFAQINIAYQTLSNTTKRSKYDADLDYEASAARNRSELGVSSRSVAVATVSAPPTPRASSGVAHSYAASTATDIHALRNQAQTEYFKGDKDHALDLCQKALSLAPANFEMLRLLGDIYADTGNANEALAAYHKALKVQPSNRMVQDRIRQLEAGKRASSPASRQQRSATIAPPAKQNFFKRLISGAK
jgi:cytochrome c-type biogenesis protein CcmH/NrfG